jgi:hypothetical protein
MKRWLKRKGCEKNREAMLIEGIRTINLAWNESDDVKVAVWWENIKETMWKQNPSESQQTIVYNENMQIQNKAIRLENFELKRERCYTIRVIGLRITQRYTFIVIDKEKMPSNSPVQFIEQSKELTETDKFTFLAVWLASQGNEWVFEAYQWANMAANYETALLLKSELEKGNRPNIQYENRQQIYQEW